MSKGKSERVILTIPIRRDLNQAIEKAVELGSFGSKTAFIRYLIRRELERWGLYPLPQKLEEEVENVAEANS